MMQKLTKKMWRVVAVWTAILICVHLSLLIAQVIRSFLYSSKLMDTAVISNLANNAPQLKPSLQFTVISYLIVTIVPFIINITAGYFVSFYSRVKTIVPSFLLSCSYFVITFSFSLIVSLVYFVAPIEFFYGKNTADLTSNNPNLVNNMNMQKKLYLARTFRSVPSKLFYTFIPILLGGYLFISKYENPK